MPSPPPDADAPDVADDVVERVKAICDALPETTLRVDRSAYSFEIRRRAFCVLAAPQSPDGQPVPLLALRADPVEREVLLAIGHPYFASRSGVDRLGVLVTDATDWEEVRELVTESYRILAPKKLAALLDDGA